MVIHRTSRLAGLALGAMLALLAGTGARADVGYQSSFTQGLDSNWSGGKWAQTPTGNYFLCMGGDGEVYLVLTGLPEHSHLVVAFDLYAIGDWRGSADPKRPHQFIARLDDGRILVNTTIANPDPEIAYTQSYPDAIDEAVHTSATGAFAYNSLGFIDGSSSAPRDSTYRMVFTVPHNSGSGSVIFRVSGIGDGASASWGLDNVAVETLNLDQEPDPSASLFGPASFSAYTGPRYQPETGQQPFVNKNPRGGGGDVDQGGGGGGNNNPPAPPVPGPGPAALFGLGAAYTLRRPSRRG
jgi:hypothetical protein